MTGDQYEAVCVCGHAQDEHSPRCQKCPPPRCAFFVLRHHRLIVRIGRWQGPDPVGHYWRLYAPPGSDAATFAALSEEDRAQIASTCWQDARFDAQGRLYCIHEWGHRQEMPFAPKPWATDSGLPWCVEEYLCEVIAAELTIPTHAFLADCHLPTSDLAELYEVEEWAVRFKLALLGGGLA